MGANVVTAFEPVLGPIGAAVALAYVGLSVVPKTTNWGSRLEESDVSMENT